MTVAPHILAELGLTDTATRAELEAALARADPAAFGVLYTNESREQLIELFDTHELFLLESYTPRQPIRKWLYRSIFRAGEKVAEMLQAPEGSVEEPPPSHGERLLARAWNSDPTCLPRIGPGSPARSMHGDSRLIVAWSDHALAKSTLGKFLVSAFNGDVEQAPYQPLRIETENFIQISNPSPDSTQRTDIRFEIFSRAICENSVRWRFLGLYRIFEYEYLHNALAKFNQEFLFSPKSAISTAEKIIQSEKNQLINLVNESNLSVMFEGIKKLFISHLSAGNSLCFAIKKEMDLRKESNDPQMAMDSSYGAAIVYKLRCAIVHAGESGVLYERYSDADAFLGKIITYMEDAALSLTGVFVADRGEDLADTAGQGDYTIGSGEHDTSADPCALFPGAITTAVTSQGDVCAPEAPAGMGGPEAPLLAPDSARVSHAHGNSGPVASA